VINRREHPQTMLTANRTDPAARPSSGCRTECAIQGQDD